MSLYNHPLFISLQESEKKSFQQTFAIVSKEMFDFLNKIIKSDAGVHALEEFLFEESATTPTGNKSDHQLNTFDFNLINLIEAASNTFITQEYAFQLLNLMKTLLSRFEKDPENFSLIRICSSLSTSLAEHPKRIPLLSNWFNLILFKRTNDENNISLLDDVFPNSKIRKYYIDDSSNKNLYILFKFLRYVIKGVHKFEDIVVASIAEALIINIQTLITNVRFDSNNVFFHFSGLFSALILLMSIKGNNDGQINAESIGHFKLIREVVNWLSACEIRLFNSQPIDKSENVLLDPEVKFMIESCYQMISYLSDIFTALEYHLIFLKNRKDMPNEEDVVAKKDKKDAKFHPIYIDDECKLNQKINNNQSDDETEDETDDDLDNHLCTYTFTRKEFINQHWYHCHTCKMLNGVGVCTVCAKVCHRGHDVTYSKHGSFFCDCGANEEGSCKALVKRQSSVKKTPKIAPSMPSSKVYEMKKLAKKNSLRISKYWHTSFYTIDSSFSKLSDSYKISKNKFANQAIVKNYDRFGLRHEDFERYTTLLSQQIIPIQDNVIALIEYFMPILENFYQNDSELGYLSKMKKEFNCLHQKYSSFVLEKSDQLMLPIKASQDSVFENVQITNEQTQSVRHLSLITGAVLRRVALLIVGSDSFSTAAVKSPLLIVAHNKKYLSIISLNDLLGQIYTNSKKRLNIQKACYAKLPFTVMNLSSNVYNDELIAVSGLKECCVLTINGNGSISKYHYISLAIDVNNYIIKTFWIPDSAAELVVVTSDYIKIYDLSQNSDNPVYNFVLPSRKIRDATFFSSKENNEIRRYILILSSHGHIYNQELNSDCKCTDMLDVFYVSAFLIVTIPYSSSQHIWVGFSIYYSHLLNMLFVSFLNGKSFVTSFSIENINSQEISNFIDLNHTGISSDESVMFPDKNEDNDSVENNEISLSQSSQTQPLCQWTEVNSHPGLIYAMTLDNNPVCFLVQPQLIKIQTIKIKKKLIDSVVVSSNQIDPSFPDSTFNHFPGCRITTLISLCEDGSLRFHRAVYDNTDFWLKPYRENLCEYPSYFVRKSRSSSKFIEGNKLADSVSPASSNKAPKFAVDFFERCSAMNEIEFGGSDVLEVYNTQQLKNRLNTVNMYIACTKPNGFSITITQTGAFDYVMAGVRVNLGVCDPARTPSAIEIFGRKINVNIVMSRWFDIPFTRSEMKMLSEVKKFEISFAASKDPNQITIVDCIKVYGRSRSSIGLNSDDDIIQSTASTSNNVSGTCLTNDLFKSDGSFIKSDDSEKSVSKKIRSILFSPTIFEEDFYLARRQYSLVLIANSLVANSFDVLEALHSFLKASTECNSDKNSISIVLPSLELLNNPKYKEKCDAILSCGSKIMTISLSNHLDKSICMMMSKLLPNKTQYDEHLGEIVFENAIEDLKQRSYDNINIFCHNLHLFRETVKEHPRNFIRFIAKYYIQSNDFCTSTIHFCGYLFDILWRIYSQRPQNELLCPLTKNFHSSNFETIVKSLVFILYSSTLAVLTNSSDMNQFESHQKFLSKTCQYIVQFLCFNDPVVSFAAKKALVEIFFASTYHNVARTNIDKQSKSTMSSTKSSSSINSKSNLRDHKQSSKHASRPPASSQSNSASVSGVNNAPNASLSSNIRNIGNLIRRNSTNRRSRDSNSVAHILDNDFLWNSRQDSVYPASRSSNTDEPLSSNRTAANLLDRVTESLLDSDLNSYQNILINIDNEFPYLQDFMATFRQDSEEYYESITGEDEDDEDEEDDDEDDEDDVDEEENEEDEEDEIDIDINFPSASQPENTSGLVSEGPSLIPISSSESNLNDPRQSNLDVFEEIHVDEDEDAQAEDEDEDDEFEAMDEDEMMEIAIALSLQEQQRGGESREIENVDEIDSQQPIRSFEEIIEDLRLHRNQVDLESSHPRDHSSSARRRLDSNGRHDSSLSVEQQPQHQQSQYSSAIHSESDEDDEELFDYEIKCNDNAMEYTEEEHEEFDDDDELNSIENPFNTPHMTKTNSSQENKTSSKMIEPKKSSHSSQTHAVSCSTQNHNFKSFSKNQKEAHKNKKRLKRLIASQFCLNILKQMNNSFESINNLNGITSIPYFQVNRVKNSICIIKFNFFICQNSRFFIIFSTLIIRKLIKKNLYKFLIIFCGKY